MYSNIIMGLLRYYVSHLLAELVRSLHHDQHARLHAALEGRAEKVFLEVEPLVVGGDVLGDRWDRGAGAVLDRLDRGDSHFEIGLGRKEHDLNIVKSENR